MITQNNTQEEDTESKQETESKLSRIAYVCLQPTYEYETPQAYIAMWSMATTNNRTDTPISEVAPNSRMHSR